MVTGNEDGSEAGVRKSSMMKNIQRILAAGIVAIAVYPVNAIAWKRAKHISYPAITECLSENLCVFVSCPARGKLSLEMMVYEHGRMPGEEIITIIDGIKFPLVLPERGQHDLYRWSLSSDLADALMKGKRGEVRIDPDVKGRPLPLRGSNSAIGKVQAQCAETSQMRATKAGGGR